MLSGNMIGLAKKLVVGFIILITSTIYCAAKPMLDGVHITEQINLVSIDGEKDINIAESKNVIVMHIWASWCGYCRREHELWSRISKKPGVEYYSVSFRERPEDTINYLNEKGDPFDKHFMLDYDNAKKINVKTIPDTIVIYQNKIMFRNKGSMDKKKFDQLLERLDRVIRRASE